MFLTSWLWDDKMCCCGDYCSLIKHCLNIWLLMCVPAGIIAGLRRFRDRFKARRRKALEDKHEAEAAAERAGEDWSGPDPKHLQHPCVAQSNEIARLKCMRQAVIAQFELQLGNCSSALGHWHGAGASINCLTLLSRSNKFLIIRMGAWHQFT